MATAPRLKDNQRAITLLAKEAAKAANSWVYISEPTGTGKTTEMLEIGYLAALDLLVPGGRSKVTLRIVLMTAELVEFNKKLFAAK